ncbi:alpha/beta-hydrolase family protein [Brachybacterium muris]|uniref:alpha/beta hydrolase n=1 Tax=Brachybacterium muris TaxID=219301 RepID=UPI0021A8DEEF|nr:alpha/beta-hydrolase family protein [Brachybacterium muris]MCT1430840.1 alpha/beta-hydrolase family protein [Brachybacterium muris]
MVLGLGTAVTGIGHAARGVASVLRGAGRITGQQVRRTALRAPLDTGGFLGASAASWIATSPSLLPRTWWMWTTNFGFSQIYGYATGALTAHLLARGTRALGLEVHITAERRRRARLLGGAALTGITAYSWVRGVLRQREISHLVQQEPKNLATHVVGTVAGVGASIGALLTARAVLATARMYRALLRPYLPPRVVGVTSLLLTVATVALVAERVVRGRILERAIERAEATNLWISPDIAPPTSPLRSGSRDSLEEWTALGAQGRRIVSFGADARLISETTGAPAMEPIRVYAGKSSTRSLDDAVDAVLAELDRTGAWDREVLVLFTGTGTGWLQEWSLSAIEFLTGGNCATASLQYSVYTSALNYILDRRGPQQAGHQLFHAVSRRLERMPRTQRPRLFVAGESLGSFGGHAAFRDLPDMLARVDGAVWSGTPGFTPIWRELVAKSRPGSPAIAPILDNGRHVRVVTRPRELHQDYWGGLYEPWQSPRIVYAQHPSDPVAWWEPSLLWEEPAWLRERVGHDVTPAIRWFPWITFWQIAADMPLSIKVTAGHGHAYHEELVPIWAAVLGTDGAGVAAGRDTATGGDSAVGGAGAPGGADTLGGAAAIDPAEQRRYHRRIVEAIRALGPAD